MGGKRIDEGLVLIGLGLLAVGLYILYSGEIFISRLTVTEGQSMGGSGAIVVGLLFVAGGAYFLWQSRR